MNKSLVLSTVLICVCFGGGYAALRMRSAAEAERVAQARAGDLAAIDRSAHEVERLKTALAAMEEESAQLKAEQARLLAEIARRGELEAGVAVPASATEAAAATTETSKVDWRKFSSLMAKNLDVLKKSLTEDDNDIPQEDKVRLMELWSELMKIERYAHEISSAPFFTPELLLPMLKSLNEESLALSPEQTTAMEAMLTELARDHLDGFDVESSLPSERYAMRHLVLEEYEREMDRLIDDPQRDDWKTVAEFSKNLFRGDRDELSFGVELDKPAPAIDRTIDEWTKAFKLDDSQKEVARRCAEAFVRGGLELLTKSREEAGGAELSPAAQASYHRQLLDLQIAEERNLCAHLTPEQRAKLRNAAPVILRMLLGAGHNGMNRSRGLSF